MYNIPHGQLGCRKYVSNTNSTEETVDTIIKRYSQPVGFNMRSNSDNISYNHRSFPVSKNYQCANDLQPDECNQNTTNESSLDPNLYNFIKNYCREEIQKEIRSKLSEKNVQDSFRSKRFDDRTETSTNLKEYIDKATYCRPVLNLYNEEFIYKTIEKNARLTRLTKKLVTAHHRHIQNEAWNNFINVLKNKHAHDSMHRRYTSSINATPVERNILRYDNDFSELIDDCCSTKHLFGHSNHCQKFSEDFYTNINRSQINYNKHNRELYETKYSQEPFCDPEPYLGRLSMLQREKQNQARMNTFENHSNNNIITVNHAYTTQKQNHHYNEPLQFHENNNNISKSFKSTTIQTNQDDFLFINSTIRKDTATEINQDFNKYTLHTDSNNTYTSKHSIEQSHNDIKEVSLRHIEDKLETIIDSINSFIKELKPKKKARNRHNACINLICKECHNVRTELIKKYNEDVLLEGEKFNSSDSIIPVNNINSSLEQYNNNPDIEKLNQIFTKQLGDENKANRNRTCAVQIAFEVPTKERSTEITKSLSQTWKHLEEKVEEIIVPDIHENAPNMTIAVNTDPLSFLALLRISTEAMKRLLSYMPNFDYYYYLSRLQFPQLPKSFERQFICNICGAHFKKPSDLNDHIQDHDLGDTKDCCVCRHVLENLGRTSCLFSCRYCGQCFTRAYCCELHQETCARRLGKQHDVDSELLLLR